MVLLNKNYILIILIGFVILSLFGCLPKPMTYDEFTTRFQKECPRHYLVIDLAPDQQKTLCDCILQHTQTNYPDMASLLAGIRKLDREPRGETDYVPSAIRMAAKTCINKDIEVWFYKK